MIRISSGIYNYLSHWKHIIFLRNVTNNKIGRRGFSFIDDDSETIRAKQYYMLSIDRIDGNFTAV